MITKWRFINPKDCFAYGENGVCKALKSRSNCIDCKFFRTRRQYLDSLESCYALLRKKPTVEQVRISDVYYCGNMPWWDREE